MCHQPLSDKGWLRQFCPQATPADIAKFIESVGMKVDDVNPPLAVLIKARNEALKEFGY